MRTLNLLAYIFVACVTTFGSAFMLGIGFRLGELSLVILTVPFGILMGCGAYSMWRDIAYNVAAWRHGQKVDFQW